MMSVVIEGSVTAVVLVAGAAAGSYTAKQIQHHAEQRIISMGEEGSTRKVLLVRPHRAKNKRFQADVDIVQAAEFEIPTDDKVLLLVSRILNDRLSLPGHVYRVLIQEHRKRANERKLDDIAKLINDLERKAQDGNRDDGSGDFNEAASKLVRFRRLNAHAVIKHVTATLLEVRPGFASSPTITEMTATAVEGLVFGQLYDSVLEEILEETRCVDEDLMAKVAKFAQGKTEDLMEMDDVSKKALHTLAQIPQAHSPVDKLRECVKFLEQISDHFAAPNHKALGADSLLKMVCLHLVIANVPFMNAEVVFLEEFARDERLLQGKEGYALVTLQASLHFLNASIDFENDIFFADED
ncbi:vacuolar sorting protein 9 (VPS9) domain containing protein [Fragilaria crotonensis]|nr:vacuolar sorting protein 9 (VPS9) domain containing protein [Fragilaria crotonensis]